MAAQKPSMAKCRENKLRAFTLRLVVYTDGVCKWYTAPVCADNRLTWLKKPYYIIYSLYIIYNIIYYRPVEQ